MTDPIIRKAELLATAANDQQLRVLISCGLLDFLADDYAISDFLELVWAKEIEDHLMERCRCDLTDGGYGYCYIAQWYEGCRDGWEVITDMEQDYFASCFKQYFKSM